MRSIITRNVSHMAPPSPEQREDATRHGGDAAYNADLQNSLPCLTSVEVRPPAVHFPKPAALTVATWNMERCKRVEESAALIRQSGADVVLAIEMDWGMARSAQRHTTQELAETLGMGYAYGVEFVELGTGDPYETNLFGDVPNMHGLHGNAILSRYPLLNAALVPLDAGGLWFVTQPKNDGQFRIGGRMGVTAQIETNTGPLTLGVVHYESESDPALRASQTARFLEGVEQLYGTGPAVLGGDLNTIDLMDGTRSGMQILSSPETIEPSFAAYAAAGFDWRRANTGYPTTRAAPGKPVRYPLLILDWLFTRGVHAGAPQIWPAVSDAGAYLSDHEMITARVLV